MSFVSNHLCMYYNLQSGRAPLHDIMSAFASLHDRGDEYFLILLRVVDRLIKAGADVNVVDKVSYHIITMEYSCDNDRYVRV